MNTIVETKQLTISISRLIIHIIQKLFCHKKHIQLVQKSIQLWSQVAEPQIRNFVLLCHGDSEYINISQTNCLEFPNSVLLPHCCCNNHINVYIILLALSICLYQCSIKRLDMEPCLICLKTLVNEIKKIFFSAILPCLRKPTNYQKDRQRTRLISGYLEDSILIIISFLLFLSMLSWVAW